MEKENVFLCGGDKRSVYMAEYFLNKGYNVSCFGHQTGDRLDDISNADMVILGLPGVKNGMVNMPLCETELAFDELLSRCPKKALLFGGRFSEKDIILANEYEIETADYSQDEIFQLENAFYTAEGAFCALVENTADSLWGMNILVTGGGRIAKELVSLMTCAPCRITVFARSEIQRCFFAAKGCNVISAVSDLSEFDAVINTVPADVFDWFSLGSLKNEAVIIDLSQRPGYVDKDKCQKLGIKLIYLPGLPLTSAPRSAGITAAKAAERLYNSKERI